MKKIMFNDRYGLTKAVLGGRKTMTRRVIPAKAIEYILRDFKREYFEGTLDVFDSDKKYIEQYYLVEKCGKCFRPGDIVAVAQKYSDFRWPAPQRSDFQDILRSAGWNNKMSVRADLMPHQIRITNVRIERLQDISDEDVYKEGFTKETVNNGWGNYAHHWEAVFIYYDSLGRTKEIRSPYPREAFAALIDKVSGKGTFESNPWVFVYEFELVQ